MKTIYKYEFPIRDQCVVSMPIAAKLLVVGVQDGRPVIWAAVDTAKQECSRILYVRGTGHPMGNAEAGCYIGTVFMGPLVFHIFDGGEA